jgi:hypothetical protein
MRSELRFVLHVSGIIPSILPSVHCSLVSLNAIQSRVTALALRSTALYFPSASVIFILPAASLLSRHSSSSLSDVYGNTHRSIISAHTAPDPLAFFFSSTCKLLVLSRMNETITRMMTLTKQHRSLKIQKWVGVVC